MEHEVTAEDAIKLSVKLEIVQTFGIKDIEDTWNKTEYGLAVLKAAITVETVLFYHLLNTLSLNRSNSAREKIRKEIDDWTLGKCIAWCRRLEIFVEEELEKLQSLVEERNRIVHERGYLDKGKNEPIIRAKWEGILKIAKEFIQNHGAVKVV